MRYLVVTGIALAVLCGGASAQMYRWVDKDGRVHYTQTPPPPDAKTVQKKNLGSGNTAPSSDLPYATQTAARNFPVTLYTTPTCGSPCDQARALLVRRAIPFKEASVLGEKDIENLRGLAPNAQVPFLVVGSQKQSGYSQEAYDSLLDSAGYATSGPRVPLETLRTIEQPKPSAPSAPQASQTPAAGNAPDAAAR